MSTQAMTIGKLAQAAGVTTKTIRYYEQLGLIEAPRRSASGYRLYSPDMQHRLTYITQAKRLGLSLREIQELLDLYHPSQVPCGHMLALMDQKLQQIETMMRDLEVFQRHLQQLRDTCQNRIAHAPEPSPKCDMIKHSPESNMQVPLTWLEGYTKRGTA